MRRLATLMALLAAISAGCGDDVARNPDASVDAAINDAGPDGRPVTCPALACVDTAYCDVSVCGGSGTCRAKPMTCPLSFNPVCGCNRVTYQNDCNRKNAGVGLAGVGPCSEACGLTPRSTSCCFSDGDCSGQQCAGALCEARKEGRCVTPPQAGRCWYDYQCGDAGVCQGAALCPCGASCLVADMPGTCGSP